MYEFWGYCVFGGASLTTHGTGSFAATTPFGGSLPGNFTGAATTIAVGSNGLSLPQATINVASTTGFPTSGTIYVYTNAGTQTVTYTGVNATQFTGCSGGTGTMSTGNTVSSASLMTFGSDGYTNATTIFRQDGYTDFYATGIKFTSNMVGKQLVMWKAGSNSSEDSIYNIIGFKDQNNIIINVNNGGTPSSINDGYRPTVTTRSSINYRVIDIASAGATGVADGNFMVFQLDATGINTGQANPQLQLIVANTNTRLDYNMSPEGNWNGTAFTSGSSGTRQPNFASAGTANQAQNSGPSGPNMTITMIGDKDFFIGYGKDQAHGSSAGFHWHWEIPERLYTQAQDPNPFAVSINGYNTVSSVNFFHSTGTTYGYGGGFVMRCNDNIYRTHRTTVKALIGDGDTDRYFSNFQTIPKPPGNALADFRAGANQFTGTLINSSGFLTLPGVAGQYSLARVRLRRARFANTFMKVFTRFSTTNADWMLVTQGIALPWDKTVLPLTIFTFG